MFDTKAEIFDQLRAGEDSRAEFEEVRLGDRSVLSPNTDDFAGELVAFANSEGGVVFLGVTDDGVVRGIPKDRLDLVEQWAAIAGETCSRGTPCGSRLGMQTTTRCWTTNRSS